MISQHFGTESQLKDKTNFSELDKKGNFTLMIR